MASSVDIINLYSYTNITGAYPVYVHFYNDTGGDLTALAHCIRSTDGHKCYYPPEPIISGGLGVVKLYLFDHVVMTGVTHTFTTALMDDTYYRHDWEQRVSLTVFTDSAAGDMHDHREKYDDYKGVAAVLPKWLPDPGKLLKGEFKDGYLVLKKGVKLPFSGEAAKDYPYTLAVDLRKRPKEPGKPGTVTPLKPAALVPGGAKWDHTVDPAAIHIESGDLIEFAFESKGYKPLRLSLAVIDPDDKAIQIIRPLKHK